MAGMHQIAGLPVLTEPHGLTCLPFSWSQTLLLLTGRLLEIGAHGVRPHELKRQVPTLGLPTWDFVDICITLILCHPALTM